MTAIEPVVQQPSLTACEVNLQHARTLVDELFTLAQSSRESCANDACQLLYCALLDGTAKMRSMIEWRSRELHAACGTTSTNGPDDGERRSARLPGAGGDTR